MVIVAAPRPRHGHSPRLGLLERALRRQPLAAHDARPPRRSRQLRVLPARAGLRHLPWVALAPAALPAWSCARWRTRSKQAVYRLGGIWFVAGYALVSLSMTKFHHYVLPAIPGLAIVIGCFLDDVLEKQDVRRARLAASLACPACRDPRGPAPCAQRLAEVPVALQLRLRPQPDRAALAETSSISAHRSS